MVSLRTWWHELFAGAFGALALLVFFGARTMGAHWNLWFLWLMVAVASGSALRVLCAFKGWMAPLPWSAGAAAGQRAQAALRVLAWGLPLAAIWTAVLPTQLGEDLPAVRVAMVGLTACCVLGALWPVQRRAWAGTVALVVAGGALVADLAAGLAPPVGPTMALQSPFSEPALVFHGGGSVLLNHHAGLPQQAHALDLVLAPDGSEQVGDPTTLKGWACFGAPLHAPVAGEVVAARSDRPDMPIGQMDTDVIVGNHVILMAAPDRYVLLAHLQQGSVAVSVGDRVEAGALLGRCGNSGNTSQPHLHLQVQTAPVFSDEDPDLRTVPVVWPRVERGEAVLRDAAARRNDVVLAAER